MIRTSVFSAQFSVKRKSNEGILMIQFSFSSESSLPYLYITQFSFLAENRPPKLDIIQFSSITES